MYLENENSEKSVASSALLHIYNVQTKGIQHKSKKSKVMSAIKAEGYTSWSTYGIASY